MPNRAASSSTASTSFTPPSRQASIWQNARPPACINCLNTTRLGQCSPVATPIGAIALAMAPCPMASSGLVGSTIHSGLNRASGSMWAIASGTSHTWLASIMRWQSGPISSRSTAARATFCSSFEPTFILNARQPAARYSRHSARTLLSL